jgi:hypothetical protein
LFGGMDCEHTENERSRISKWSMGRRSVLC